MYLDTRRGEQHGIWPSVPPPLAGDELLGGGLEPYGRQTRPIRVLS